MKLYQKSVFMFFAIGMVLHTSAQIAETKSSPMHTPKEHHQALKINLVSPFYGTLNLSWQTVLNSSACFQVTASYTDFDSYGSVTDESRNEDNYTTTRTVNGNQTTETTTSRSIISQRTQGFAVTPEYRYMLNGRNLTGFYIAPFARYMYYEYSRQMEFYSQTVTYLTSQPYPSLSNTSATTTGSDLFTYHTLGLGVTVGKQIMFKNKVVIDCFAGPVYSILLSSNQTVRSTSDVVIGTGIPNLYIRGYGVRAGITIGLAY